MMSAPSRRSMSAISSSRSPRPAARARPGAPRGPFHQLTFSTNATCGAPRIAQATSRKIMRSAIASV